MTLRREVSDETGATKRYVPYQRAAKERRTERRKILVPYQAEIADSVTSPLVCSTDHYGERSCTQSTRTTTSFVTSYREEWVDEDVLADVMVDDVDVVAATSRTTTLATVGDVSVTIDDRITAQSVEARPPITEYEYASTLAGRSEQFGEARPQLVSPAAAQLRAVIIDLVQRASDAHRVATLRASLTTLNGGPRLSALLELSVLERGLASEVAALVAAQTGLELGEVSALFRGQVPTVAPVSSPDLALSFDWPEPDAAGVEGLKLDEARAVVRTRKDQGCAVILGLVYLDNPAGARFGGSLAFSIERTPSLFLFRAYSVTGFVRGAFDLFPREHLILRTNATVGLAIGLHPPLVDLHGYAEGGLDHGFVAIADDEPPTDEDLASVPAALVAGVGARLRIADKLSLEARHQRRLSDTYPDRWEAEARWGTIAFFGLRATAHRDVFGGAGADRAGPIVVGLTAGVRIDLSSASADLLTTASDRVR